MPRCPSCRLEWPADFERCPADGASLVKTGDLEFAKTVTPSRSQPSGSGPRPLPFPDVPAGTTLGEYTIEEKLGEGGMGCVYAATHSLLGKKAAIKVLARDPGPGMRTAERVLDEARAVNEIGHPNIVEIFAFGALEDGRPYMVMDRLRGETLAQRLKRGCLSLEEAAHVVDQVCRALQAVHEKGVIHRDLKPENVFLVNVGPGFPLVKLLDFGIARLAQQAGKKQRDTLAGSMVGTPLYVSPEAARGLGVDTRTDIYSLGVVLYEAVLDRPPFQGKTAVDTIAMHLHDEPPRPSELWPGIPPALEELLLRMLAKEADGRPTLAEVRKVMAELEAAERPGSAVIPVPPYTPPAAPAEEPAPPPPRRTTGELPKATAPPPDPGPAAAAAPPRPDETAEMPQARAPARGRRGAWAVGVGLTLLAVAALAFLAWPRRDLAAPPAPDDAAPVAAPASAPLPGGPARGTLVVRPTPLDARVVIDGKEVPLVAGAAQQRSAAGWHEIVVTAPGHVQLTTKVQVAAEARVVVPIQLVPAPEAPRKAPPRRVTRGPGPAAPPVKAPAAPSPPPPDDMPIDPFGKKR